MKVVFVKKTSLITMHVFLSVSLLNKLSGRHQAMEYGWPSQMVKKTPHLLMQMRLFHSTRTWVYFIILRKRVTQSNYLGIKSQHYLTWPDYSSSYISPKLQAYCTVSFCLRYVFFLFVHMHECACFLMCNTTMVARTF